MATLLGSSPGSPGAEGSETTLGTEEGQGRGEAWGLRSPSSRGRSGEGPPACLGMGVAARWQPPSFQAGHVAAERAIEAQVCLRSYPIYYR